MSYAIKLFIPVFLIAFAAKYLLRNAFTKFLTPSQYHRAWVVIFLTIIISFLSITLPILFVALGAMMIWAPNYLGGGGRGRVVTAMLTLIILPSPVLDIGGFGGINYLLQLSTLQELVIIVLIPAAILEFTRPSIAYRPLWARWVDYLVLGYQLLKWLLILPNNNASNAFRFAVVGGLDVIIPYYVISRYFRNEDDFKFYIAHLTMGASLAAIVGCVEFFIHYNLYSGLQWVYGQTWQLTQILMRGSFLRVQAMTSQPISLAVEMIFALGFWLSLSGHLWSEKSVKFIFILMLACLGFTISRGPWIGAAAFFCVVYALKTFPVKIVVLLLLTLLIGGGVVKAAGADDAVMNVLSLIFGNSAEDLDSINYRRLLLDSATALIAQSPWLGVPNYAAQLQSLRQGEGIVDLVNNYIAISLDTGLIGLGIYMLPYVLVIYQLLKASSKDALRPWSPSMQRLARTFTALIIGALLTIFTTSVGGTTLILMLMLLAVPVGLFSKYTLQNDVFISVKAANAQSAEVKPHALYGAEG